MTSVLLVDDEPALLDITSLFIKKYCTSSIDTALSAMDALEKIKARKFDVVVADYEMPGMNGIELLKSLRSQGDTTPFIIFTGRGRETVAIEALNCGADFYLQKGGDPKAQFAELRNMITKAVKQKRAEKDRRLSERRMTEIINHLPEATFAIDKEGKVIAWNIAIEQMTGVPAAAILGKGNYEYALPFFGTRRPLLIDSIFEPDDVLRERGYTIIQREGSALIAETATPRPKGRSVVIWAKATPFYDERGERAGAIETMRDITGQRQAEQALQEREMQYRALIETTGTGYVIIDTKGRVLDANPEYVRLTGHRELKEILGRNVTEWTADYEKEKNAESVRKCSHEGGVRNLEIDYVDSAGNVTPVEINATVLEIGGETRILSLCRDIAGRRRAEQTVRESENLFRAIFNNTGTATTIIAKDTSILLANSQWADITGVSEAELIGKSWTEFVDKEDVEMMKQFHYARRIDPSLAPRSYEFRLIDKNNCVHHCFVYGGMIAGTTNSVVSVLDVTEWKRAEAELRASNEQIAAAFEQLESTETSLKEYVGQLETTKKELQENEARLHAIIDGSPIPQFVIDSRHRVIYWNKALEEHSGIRAGDVVGTNRQWRAFYPHERPCLADLLVDSAIEKIPEWYQGKYSASKLLEGAYEATDFFPKMGKTGTWLYFTAAPVRDAKGTIIGAVETLENITDRKRAEDELMASNKQMTAALEELTTTEEKLVNHVRQLEAAKDDLQKSEERYRAVVQSQTEFISRFLPNGTHLFVNEAYCRYFGKTCDEIIGHPFVPEIPAEEREEVKRHFASLTQDSPVASIEHRIIMSDGEVRWQQWSDRAIFDADGRLVEYQSVGRDITERKLAEEALKRANKKLNLMSTVTRHDILNQLTVLSGYLELSRDLVAADATLMEYFSKEATAVETIRRQITFTRLYQDIGVHSPEWQNVRETLIKATSSISLGSVTLEFALDDVEVYADPLLEKVFYNLVENAVRHGEAVTRITFSGTISSGRLNLICEDDGIGIPANEKEKIFERGYGKHTGFGLFLAKEILSITGLSIEETGEPEKGARFEIQVPPGEYRIVMRENDRK